MSRVLERNQGSAPGPKSPAERLLSAAREMLTAVIV